MNGPNRACKGTWTVHIPWDVQQTVLETENSKKKTQHQSKSARGSEFNMHSSGRDGLSQSVHMCLQKCLHVMPSPSPTKNVQGPWVPGPPASASGLLDTPNPVNQELPKISHFNANRHKGGEESEIRNKKHRNYRFNPPMMTPAYWSGLLQCLK